MRILLLSNLYPPYVEGGAEILAADVATGLERSGHEVFVLTSTPGSQHIQHEEHIWRTLTLAPPAHFDRHLALYQQLQLPLNYYRRYHNPSNVAELRRVIKATQPDVIYIWELEGLGVTSLLQFLAEAHVPVVFHLNSYWLLYAQSPETEQTRLRTKWFKQRLIGTIPSLPRASYIAISNTVKQHYVSAGFDAQAITVVYNGLASQFLDQPSSGQRSDAEGCARLLYVGRLRIEKGLLILLEALDILIHEQHEPHPFHLMVFGSGDAVYIKEVEAFIRDRHLSDVVTFGGTVPHDDLIKEYDQASMLIVPSLWQEPFGLVVIEAMARGVPIIASNIGGPAEIITSGANGLLTGKGDAHALADAIHELLAHPEEGTRLGQTARQTVCERFMIEKNIKQVEQYIQHIVQGENGTTATSSTPSGLQV